MKNSHIAYVKEMQSCSSCSVGSRKGSLFSSQGKSFQDQKAHNTTLGPGKEFLWGIFRIVGDRINVRHTGRKRFTGCWKGESPVYEVYQGDAAARNVFFTKKLLLPYEFLPVTQEQNSQAGNRTWSTAKISVKGNRVSEISNDSKNDYSKIPTS